MKNRLSLLLLGASLFVLTTSMQMPSPISGATDLKVEITPTDDLRVQLLARNETGKKLSLSVLMLENSLYRVTETEIYSEQFSADQLDINRMLNLSKLESGNYVIRIKAGKKHIDRLLDIRAKPFQEEKDARIILFK